MGGFIAPNQMSNSNLKNLGREHVAVAEVEDSAPGILATITPPPFIE